MRMDRRAGLLALARTVPISYTGSYTEELVTMDGARYRLFTLTSSGTLSADAQVTGDIWICGGGGSGGSYGPGGGGGYAATAINQIFQNLTVVIGAGGVGTSQSDGSQTTVSGGISLSANGGYSGDSAVNWHYGNGGSGGGQDGASNYSSEIGQGDGIAKTPFASNHFPYPYCDGGGGAGYYHSTSSKRRKGGAGGTNGGNGGSNSTGGYTGGAGGGHYGGKGANDNSTSGYAGSAATGYGSAGGGGSKGKTGGDGYQGICFIRIPA